MRPDRKTSRKQQLVIAALVGLIALFPILAFGEEEESIGAVESVAEQTGTVHCMSCHMPHSSSNLTLLKANGRALCLSCHTDKSDHRGAATCWTSGCHSEMHGSNNNMLFIR